MPAPGTGDWGLGIGRFFPRLPTPSALPLPLRPIFRSWPVDPENGMFPLGLARRANLPGPEPVLDEVLEISTWKSSMAPSAGPIIMKALCSGLRGSNGLEGNAEPSIAFWFGRANTLVRKEVVFDRHMF